MNRTTLPGAPRDPAQIENYLWLGARGELGFDVGANMGQSVEKMVAWFERVVAWEPAIESWETLALGWAEDPKVTLRNMAVADHDGELALALRAAPIQTGQLTATEMPYLGEHRDEPNTAHWGYEVGQRSVRCETLDHAVELFGVPEFVKVDTEGGEAGVLRGAPKLLALGKTRWMIEFHTRDLYTECVSLLEGAGYEVETVRHPHYQARSYMWFGHGWLRAAVPSEGT
jgi:FkbM family methyltransferase